MFRSGDWGVYRGYMGYILGCGGWVFCGFRAFWGLFFGNFFFGDEM